MTKLKGRIAPFNPGNMSPELLQELLVGKDKILKTLVGNIVSAAKEKTAPPQQLIVAPRGYGKTHLINVVYSKLKKNKAFKKHLLISFFKEEEHVSGYLDFLRRVLQALKGDPPNPELETAFKNIYENPSAETIGETEIFLNSYVGDRLLVIMCENLGEIFDGLEKEGQLKLRAFLQNSGKISLFCTSQKLYEPLKAKNFPFHGFFSRTELEPFSDNEAWRLLKRLADNAGDPELSKYLDTKVGKARVSAVCELTSGNPRLIALLSGFLNKEKLDGLIEAFLEMIETSLTPYYQEQMARLAPLQRRIIEILCEKGDGNYLSVNTIAGKALTSSQSISHQLRKMQELGVLASGKKGRETFYGMAEPLWRVSIEVKNNTEGILPVVVGVIKITKSLDEIYAGVLETSAQQNAVFLHMICALRERCKSLQKNELGEVYDARLIEIADSLPEEPEKAEKLTQTFLEIFDDSCIFSLNLVLKILNNPSLVDSLSEIKECEGSALSPYLQNHGLLRRSLTSDFELKNFLLFAKYFLLSDIGIIRPSVLFEISSGDQEFLFFTPYMLNLSDENELAIEWLLKMVEDPEKHKEMKIGFLHFRGMFLAVREDKIVQKAIWLDAIFPAFEKIDASFFEGEPDYFLMLLFVFINLDLKQEALKLLGILGDKWSKQDQYKFLWLICRSLVQKNSEVFTFWQEDKSSFLKAFKGWNKPNFCQTLLAACDGFAVGDDEQVANLPLEFRQSLEKARHESYFEFLPF